MTKAVFPKLSECGEHQIIKFNKKPYFEEQPNFKSQLIVFQGALVLGPGVVNYCYSRY